MQRICAKHEEGVHSGIEGIINRFKEDTAYGSEEQDKPPSTVTCAQVDSMLAYAASAGYHQLEHHAPEWETVVHRDKQRPGIACAKCGIFFTNRVIEAARQLGIL